MIGLNDSVRAQIQRALDAPDTPLEVLVRVSPTGWSHRLAALRHFVYRDRELVACVKQIPKHRAPDAEAVTTCYRRFAERPRFGVPRLLGSAEDAEHLYFIESAVPGRSLAALVAAGTLSAEAAAELLDGVLLDVWEQSIEADEALVERSAGHLLAAADAVFRDEPMRALAAAAIAALRTAHRAELRAVLTSHDITAANVLHDDAGRTWLTDFDLAGETTFFGIDCVRSWLHSSPLQPPQPPPSFAAPAARPLYRTLAPLLEYHLQAPHLPPPRREELRRYVQDLFVRLALPEYHGRATFQPIGRVEHPAHAQLFLSDTPGSYSESESLRLPFDGDSGRLQQTVVLNSGHPVRYLRLDPTDVAHSVIIVQRYVVRRGNDVVDVAARCRAGDASPTRELELVDLLALPGSATAFWSAGGDPQIIVDLGASSRGAVTIELELETVRDWQRHPRFDANVLLPPLHGTMTALWSALGEAAQRCAILRAESRAMGRALREAEVTAPASAAPAYVPATLADSLRDVARRPRAALDALRAHAPGIAAELGRAVLARAAAGVRRAPRGGSAASPAVAGPSVWLAPAVAGGRPWRAPLFSIVVRYDLTPAVEESAVQTWLFAQTCQSVEIVAWSPGVGQAWEVHHPHAVWAAQTWDDLRGTLLGRYLVAATPELLTQPPTYLECNALALETESLALTINVRADAQSALGRWADGYAPSGPVGVIARSGCVSDALGFDLTRCLPVAGATKIGKVIAQETAVADAARPVLDNAIDGARLATIGQHLIAERTTGAIAGAVSHTLRPADAVLDLPPIASELPTVLVVMPFLALGGAEKVALNWMRLLRHRLRLVVVTLEPHSAHLGTTADAFRAVTPYVYTAPDFLEHPLQFSLFAYLMRRFTPQALYIANGSSWIYDALPTIKQHFPAVRTLNQVYDHQVGWIGRYDPTLVAALDGHIVSNPQIAAAVRERGARPSTIHSIVNGVDLEEHDPAQYNRAARQALRARFRLPHDRRVVSFFARLHQQKRPMDFIELARQFADDPAVAFFMVGDGPLGEDVRQQAQRLGLRNLILRSFHRPFSELLAVTDLLVLPSEYEGMPMVIVEALAMGIPVVATDVGNNRDVLQRTAGGAVVDVGDVAAMRRAVQRLVAEPPDPAALRDAVAREFPLEAMADAYYRVFTGAAAD